MPKYDIVFIVSELVSGENVVRLRRLVGVVAGFWLFGFFMIVLRIGRSEICKFQFL